MPCSDTARVTHSNQLQEQLAALQNEVAELSIQFHHKSRNRRIDTVVSARDDQKESDRVSTICETVAGQNYDNGACQGSAHKISLHSIAGCPDPIWTSEQQNRIDSNHNNDLDHDWRCTRIGVGDGDKSPGRPAQVSQTWREKNSVSSATHKITMDSFSSIPERTTQMISDLAMTKKILHQVRRERDMYLIQFQDERTKLQEMTQKYASLFEAAERSNASLRMHLNAKEDVCQRQAELIRCLQESTQGVIVKAFSHASNELDHVTLPTASITTISTPTTLNDLSGHRSNALKPSTSPQSTVGTSASETSAGRKVPRQHEGSDMNETTEAHTKKKSKSSTRRIPARSQSSDDIFLMLIKLFQF